MKNAMQYTERIKLVPHATWVDTSKLHDALECGRHGDASVIYTTPTLLTTRCHVNDPQYPILMTSFDVTDMQCLLNEPGKMMAAVPMSTALAECTAMLVLGTQDQPEKPEGMEQAKWELQLYDEMVKDIDVKTMGTWLETTRGYRYMFAITDEPPLTDAESKPETVKTIVVNRHPDMMNIDYSDISRSAAVVPQYLQSVSSYRPGRRCPQAHTSATCFAGTPIINANGGTFPVTTAPAAIMQYAPNSIPGQMVAAAPIELPSRTIVRASQFTLSR